MSVKKGLFQISIINIPARDIHTFGAPCELEFQTQSIKCMMVQQMILKLFILNFVAVNALYFPLNKRHSKKLTSAPSTGFRRGPQRDTYEVESPSRYPEMLDSEMFFVSCQGSSQLSPAIFRVSRNHLVASKQSYMLKLSKSGIVTRSVKANLTYDLIYILSMLKFVIVCLFS